MRKSHLLPALCSTYRLWRRYRSNRLLFERWLRGGQIDFKERPTPENLFGCVIKQAVHAGADGVLFNHRRLTGIREIETHDDFWTLTQGTARSDWLAKQPQPISVEDAKHIVRFGGFERIDMYHITKWGLMLVGGVESTFEANIDILNDALSRPWKLVVSGGEDLELRGKEVTVMLSDSAQYQAVQGVSFSIEYG